VTAYCGTPNTLRLEARDSAGALTASLDLMNEASGYRVETLDVGFPTVRDQTSALPTRDGDLDYTRLYGPRATATATNLGNYRAWPVLDIYGPCSNPTVEWVTPAAGSVVFAGLTIAAGHFVRVDTAAQTALLDGSGASQYPLIDFRNTRWAGLEPGATVLRFTPSTSSSPARVVATWADSSI
jgi:hypothetical protein